MTKQDPVLFWINCLAVDLSEQNVNIVSFSEKQKSSLKLSKIKDFSFNMYRCSDIQLY